MDRRTVLAGGIGVVGSTLLTHSVAVTLEDFGGGPHVSDNVFAMQKALARANGGGTIQLKSGVYKFDSHSLQTNGGLEIGDGVTIRGAGKGSTTLLVQGDRSCYLFVNRSGDHQRITDLTLRGNGVGGNGPGGAYYCVLDKNSQKTSITDCVIGNVRLENFGGDFWIRLYAAHAGRTIRSSGLSPGCEAQSEPGNARNPHLLGVTSAIVEFRGEEGTIEDCFIDGLEAYLAHVKTGIALFSRCHRTRIHKPVLRDAFQALRVPDKGGYAILVYDYSDVVTDTIINSPEITRPFSCGIYAAGSKNLRIIRPKIRGQSDVADQTLPKGAIALNGANDVVVISPELEDNAIDIVISGISDDRYNSNMGILIDGGSGKNATSAGILVRPSVYAEQCGGIVLRNYSSTTNQKTASALQWIINPPPRVGVPAHGITDFKIDGGIYAGGPGGYDINLNRASNIDHQSGNVEISSLETNGNDVIVSLKAVGCIAGPLTIRNVVFRGSADVHLQIEQVKHLILDRILFVGRALGGTHSVLRVESASITNVKSNNRQL